MPPRLQYLIRTVHNGVTRDGVKFLLSHELRGIAGRELDGLCWVGIATPFDSIEVRLRELTDSEFSAYKFGRLSLADLTTLPEPYECVQPLPSL